MSDSPRAAAALPVLVLTGLAWLAELVDAVVPGSFDQYGIRPRSLDGLTGIVLAPFLHVGFAHLIANTMAFLLLGAVVAWTTRAFWPVTIGVVLLGGLGVWLFAPPNTVTVGASGLIYGYAAFLVAWGVLARRLLAFVVAVVVAFVYWSLLFGVLPGQPGISWQGHLFGMIAGVLMAWWLARPGRARGFRR